MNGLLTLVGLAGIIVGGAIGLLFKHSRIAGKEKAADREAARIVQDARHRSDNLIKEAELEAKDTLFKLKSDFESDTKETRSELKKSEIRLIQKEENLDLCGLYY